MSITTLVNFVRELNDDSLQPLLNELDNKPKQYSVYFNRSKGDWKEFYGINGVDIHTFLHPQQGNLITNKLFSPNILL